ncbi:MAG: toll/interleukin-1 receptor domain-containing protein [Opitutaceae bacterium]
MDSIPRPPIPLVNGDPAEQFDVFLSHNSADKPAVEMLARKLRDSGINRWFDKWHLNGTPGPRTGRAP